MLMHFIPIGPIWGYTCESFFCVSIWPKRLYLIKKNIKKIIFLLENENIFKYYLILMKMGKTFRIWNCADSIKKPQINQNTWPMCFSVTWGHTRMRANYFSNYFSVKKKDVGNSEPNGARKLKNSSVFWFFLYIS